jgi:hypothetical protein
MGQIDDIRIQTTEELTSFESSDLSDTLKELDARIEGSNVWTTITYTLGLISKIEYFSDAAKTIKTLQREFTRTTGSDSIKYITTVVSTFYNDGGSVDSTITNVLTRSAANKITSCASVFSTTESPC